jgi:hypothetical protein
MRFTVVRADGSIYRTVDTEKEARHLCRIFRGFRYYRS